MSGWYYVLAVIFAIAVINHEAINKRQDEEIKCMRSYYGTKTKGRMGIDLYMRHCLEKDELQ